MDASKLVILDAFVKGFQILFFIIVSIVTILTYRSAKRGLLNTVNTEYQKKVIERLATVADELWGEFDTDAPDYLVRVMPVRDIIEAENKTYLQDPEKCKNSEPLMRANEDTSVQRRMSTLIRKYKSDPFLPKTIRDMIVDLCESRALVALDVYREIGYDYRKWLHSQPVQTEADLSFIFLGWHNASIDALVERGCGHVQVETEVNNIRLAIQSYLESFNPVKRWY